MDKKQERQKRQQELLTHLEGDFYQEKMVGNKWLVKNYNGNTGKWQVAEYSIDSFRRYKEYNDNQSRFRYLIEKDD